MNANDVPLIRSELPPHRLLRVFSVDPSLAVRTESLAVSETTLPLPWEDLTPGPVGEYLEVIDYDPTVNAFCVPVDLNETFPLSQAGYHPAVGDPRFHQQMVYAVGMRTIINFERAWGRRIQWAPDHPYRENDFAERFVARLRLFPHAMRAENAYYDPQSKAILFGYFRARDTKTNAIMPNSIVFTCLSADVIAHEMTHAILDGIHPRYTEDTGPDVLAFHEAFADLIALFQHFSDTALLEAQIARTRGDLDTETQLAKLATEFGQATTGYGSLRDAIGGPNANGQWVRKAPDPAQYAATLEPHARGSILVSAIFDAFLAIYKSRTRDLIRIASDGRGILPAGDIHPDLVRRLAREAGEAAQDVLRMLVRAVDYCPPLDITFAEYLRAIITADYDYEGRLAAAHERRVAFASAFQAWGIYPDRVTSMEPACLKWGDMTSMRTASADIGVRLAKSLVPLVRQLRTSLVEFEDRNRLGEALRASHPQGPARFVYSGRQGWSQENDRAFRLAEGAPSLTDDEITQFLDHLSDREVEFHVLRWFRRMAHQEITDALEGAHLDDIRLTLGLSHHEDCQQFSFEVHAARITRIPDPEVPGRVKNLLFIELTQSERTAKMVPGMKMRGGCTLVIDTHRGEVTYAIRKEFGSGRRRENMEKHLVNRRGLASLYFDPVGSPFAMVHSGVA